MMKGDRTEQVGRVLLYVVLAYVVFVGLQLVLGSMSPARTIIGFAVIGGAVFAVVTLRRPRASTQPATE